MLEVRVRSEQVIRRDALVNQHGLNERQAKALGHLLQHGRLTIQDFGSPLPERQPPKLQRESQGDAGPEPDRRSRHGRDRIPPATTA